MDLLRGQSNSKANPRVLFAWQSPNVGDSQEIGPPFPGRHLKGGFFQPFADPLTFRVLDPTGVEVVAPTAVDPTDPANQLDSPDLAGNGGKGRIIVLPFTIAAPSPTGDYTVEVTFVVTPTGGPALDPQTTSYTFRVLDEAHPFVSGAYAQITDMLANGFPVGSPAPAGGFSFADAARALNRATRFVEEVTSQFFAPRYLVHDFDGKGGPGLQVTHPIVGLTDAAFTFTTFSPADLPIMEGDLRVYNRHIRQGLLNPDDRQNPRIEFLRSPVYRFPRGQILGDTDLLSGSVGFPDSQQNVKLRGVFGYTDPDASPFGKTPDLIREVTLRLAARYIEPLWSQIGGAGTKVGFAGPISAERTLDQSVGFANLGAESGAQNAFAGVFTGDPEIDQILALYIAPPRFGSA